MKRNLHVHAALLSVAILYSANYTVAKFVVPIPIAPFGFIILRVISATLLFWLFSIPVKEKVASKDFPLLLLCSVFGVALNQLLFFKGLSYTTPINASIIMTIIPIVVLVAAYLLGREKITAVKTLGLCVGALGAYLLLTKDGADFENQGFWGDVLVLLNATSFAIYLVLVKPLMQKYEALTMVKWLFLIGGLITIPFGYHEVTLIDWSSISSGVWWAMVYVVIGATLLTYLLNTWALKSVDSSVVGIYVYFQPVFASIIAITVRGDELNWDTVVYSILIMSGVYLVSRR